MLQGVEPMRLEKKNELSSVNDGVKGKYMTTLTLKEETRHECAVVDRPKKKIRKASG